MQPITKAHGDQLRFDDYVDWTRTNAPQSYAKHMRRQREVVEWEQRRRTSEYQETLADVRAFFEQPEQKAKSEARAQSRQTTRNRAAYDLLGVQPGATQAQIRTAYRQKARELHPDKGGNESAMKKLNAAYQKLSKTK